MPFPWEDQGGPGGAGTGPVRDQHYHQCTAQVARVAGLQVSLEQLAAAAERTNTRTREVFGEGHDTHQLAIDAQSYLAEVQRLVGEAHALAMLANQSLTTLMRSI